MRNILKWLLCKCNFFSDLTIGNKIKIFYKYLYFKTSNKKSKTEEFRLENFSLFEI